ncbi:MAG: hypothetical protein K2N82_05615, partial [Lachnospiraceae bacterium]|nr:hypothetical protein [Lachnospiraceae bacterium]
MTGITVNAPGMKIQGNGVGQEIIYPALDFNEFEENNTNAVENTTEEGGEENREIMPSEEIIEETKPEESSRVDISNDEQGKLKEDSEELIYNGYDYTQPATEDGLEAGMEPPKEEIGNIGETELGEYDKEDIKKDEPESTDMQEPEELITNGFEYTQPVKEDGFEAGMEPSNGEIGEIIGDIEETEIKEAESEKFSEENIEKTEPESAEVQETKESTNISYWYIRPVEEGNQAEIDEINEEIREEIKEAIKGETNVKTDESSNIPEESNTENSEELEDGIAKGEETDRLEPENPEGKNDVTFPEENTENESDTGLQEPDWQPDPIIDEVMNEEIYVDQDSLSDFEQMSFSLFPGEEKILYFSLSNDYGRGTYISQIDVTAAELYTPCSISLKTRVYANNG